VNHHLNRRVGNFIEDFGVEALASRIGVHSSAVYHWAGARVQLKQEHARALQSVARESGVSLTLDEIYYLDQEGEEKLRTAREQRKTRRSPSWEENGGEWFDSIEAGLDFARGSTGRLR
jgi:hypothetical protein